MTLVAQLRSSSAPRQIALAAVLCAVIGGLLIAGYLTFFQTRYDVLFSNLRDADAATIIAELDKQKVPYRLRDGGSTILAPADAVPKTRLTLMSTTVPLKGTVGFELFNKSDMGLTEFAQQINYQRALQGELARTIMAMDAVDEARIHLALPEHAIFRDEAKQPKASVTVLTRPGRQLSAGTIRGIQRLVAAAVPDLDIANVVVLDGHGAVVSDSAPASPTAPLADRKRSVEESYETVIRNALQNSFPGQQIDVAVWAGLTDAQSPDTAALGPSVDGQTKAARRSFPLRVSVTAAAYGGAGQEQAIRNIVFSAIDADPNQDAISYAVSAPPPVAKPSSAKPAPPPWTATLSAAHSSRPDWVLVGGALTVLLVAAVVMRSQRGGRRLTVRQQEEYARRLRAALDGGPSDGAA